MFVPIWIIIRQYFPQLLLSTTSLKNLHIWMLMSLLKKVCFYHPFWNEETQERGNHEPLVSLRRPGSAEQVQFFSVFWSNGGKCEATVKCDSRSKEGKKKTRKNTAAPMHTKIEKPRKTFWKYFFWIYLPKRVFKASYQNFRFFQPGQWFSTFSVMGS